jgi:hypothetical protein
MTSSRRLGAVLLALVLALGLGACGDDDDSGSDSEDTSSDNGDNGDNGDDPAPDGNGDGSAAEELEASMIETGLTAEQAACSVEALSGELNDDELRELATLTTSESQDFEQDQLSLIEAAFRAAGGCGVDIFGGNLGGSDTTGG